MTQSKRTLAVGVPLTSSGVAHVNQGLRASSLQFTSPLEFNAIFRDGFTLRLKLNGWSKICDPVMAKFKHVTIIVTITLLCCDDVTYVPALWNFQKADLEPYPYSLKYTTFSYDMGHSLQIFAWGMPLHVFNFTRNYIQHCMDLQLAVDPYKRHVLFESMDWLPKTHQVSWHISANQISTKHSPTTALWYEWGLQFSQKSDIW